MTTKKIFGYALIVLSVVLGIAIVGQLPKLFSAVIEIFIIFEPTTDGYQSGLAIGSFIYWVFHFAVTIVLWRNGRRLTKATINS